MKHRTKREAESGDVMWKWLSFRTSTFYMYFKRESILDTMDIMYKKVDPKVCSLWVKLKLDQYSKS